jgi:hypothetical protein
MTLNVEDRYVNWVKTNVVTLFQAAGISITDRGKQLMAFALQAQVDEDTVVDADAALERAKRACEPWLVENYRSKYGERPVNFNRAFHLIYEMNHIVMMFPSEPT